MLRDTLFLTLQNPRAAARRVLGWQLSLGQAWSALLLVSVVSAALGYVGFALSPSAGDPQLQELFGSPMSTAIFQSAVQTLTALMVYLVGRQFGGRGSFTGALVITAWVEAPLILLQLVQLLTIGLAPALAEVAGFVGLGLYVVLLTLFITELHGFRSATLVFLGVMGVSIVVGMVVITALAALFGGLPDV